MCIVIRRNFGLVPLSWGNKKYGLQIPAGLNSAAIVQAMVFGDLDAKFQDRGIMFTRYPSTGEKEIFGEYLSEAGGEDMVGGGLHNP